MQLRGFIHKIPVFQGRKTNRALENANFRDIITQFVLQRKHTTSPLQSPAGCYVRFEVSTVVTVKNMFFWDVTSCGFVLRLLVTTNVVPGSGILFTLTMEALFSSETWVLTGAKRRHILEDCILHSHRRENLKSYKPCLVLHRHSDRLQLHATRSYVTRFPQSCCFQ
jgi:hypothetical protein